MPLDSNIVIYAAEIEYAGLRRFIRREPAFVSVVSYVEVLGHLDLSDDDRSFLEDFFRTATFLDVSGSIAYEAAILRQRRRMSLGDAIIVATALEHDLTLVTHNVRDFRWISELSLVDPLEG